MKRIFGIIIISLIPLSIIGQDAIKVMSYNLLRFPQALPKNREDTLRKIVDYYQPDILGVSELLTKDGSDLILNKSLNHNTHKYKAATYWSSRLGDLEQMLYYNSDKLVLYSQDSVHTNTREVNEYVLYLKTTDLVKGDTVFIDAYVVHLKAGSDTVNQIKRDKNVSIFLEWLKTKPAKRNRVLMGDFNVYNSNEAAYQKLTKGGVIDFYDPIKREGNWHNNSTYKDITTQSTRRFQLLGEGAGGGMDDRFDFILCNYAMLDTTNAIFYEEGSYKAIGNDGNCFNKSITDCSATPIQDALYYMSDHLPVVAEFSIRRNNLSSILVVKNGKKAVWVNKDGYLIIGDNSIHNVKIYSQFGRKVLEKRLKTHQGRVKLPTGLNPGIYFVSIGMGRYQKIVLTY